MGSSRFAVPDPIMTVPANLAPDLAPFSDASAQSAAVAVFNPDAVPIAAIATAPGRGAIGVIRLSGAGVDTVIEPLLGRALKPRHATLAPFLDAQGGVIDQGLALWFPAPHSYTGEPVLELQGHGGPVVLQRLLRRCLEVGAAIGLRIAEPGEFTRRAYLNGKLDLAQAEAVADLIDAATEAAARGAAASLSGAFSQEIDQLVQQLIDLRMLVEATLDFPEEEIEFLEQSDARGQLDRLLVQVAQVLATAKVGQRLRDGMTVVLVGRPNVGKSSLLNALAGDEVAIVTPIAGTTRDRVESAIQIDGVPLQVIDTAGLRETDDPVESLGIARTWQAIDKADVILVLRDASHPELEGSASGEGLQPALADPDSETAHTEALLAKMPAGTPRRVIWNKVDQTGDPAGLRDDGSIGLSAKRGDGLAVLRQVLLDLAGVSGGAGEGRYLARERHLAALRLAQQHLQWAARHAALNDQVLELVAEELRLAQNALSSITGEFTPDDLLGTIFSRFCIGK